MKAIRGAFLLTTFAVIMVVVSGCAQMDIEPVKPVGDGECFYVLTHSVERITIEGTTRTFNWELLCPDDPTYEERKSELASEGCSATTAAKSKRGRDLLEVALESSCHVQDSETQDSTTDKTNAQR